jgi:hypothetical protein
MFVYPPKLTLIDSNQLIDNKQVWMINPNSTYSLFENGNTLVGLKTDEAMVNYSLKESSFDLFYNPLNNDKNRYKIVSQFPVNSGLIMDSQNLNHTLLIIGFNPNLKALYDGQLLSINFIVNSSDINSSCGQFERIERSKILERIFTNSSFVLLIFLSLQTILLHFSFSVFNNYKKPIRKYSLEFGVPYQIFINTVLRDYLILTLPFFSIGFALFFIMQGVPFYANIWAITFIIHLSVFLMIKILRITEELYV